MGVAQAGEMEVERCGEGEEQKEEGGSAAHDRL